MLPGRLGLFPGAGLGGFPLLLVRIGTRPCVGLVAAQAWGVAHAAPSPGNPRALGCDASEVDWVASQRSSLLRFVNEAREASQNSGDASQMTSHLVDAGAPGACRFQWCLRETRLVSAA